MLSKLLYDDGQYEDEQPREIFVWFHASEYLTTVREIKQIWSAFCNSRWQLKNDNLGIWKHPIHSLGKKNKTDPENYTNCTLVIDAMSIKKLQLWVLSKQKVVEVVDPIVHLAVGTCIRKRWKALVSFHLTKGLKSETQKTIALDAIELLCYVGLNVRLVIVVPLFWQL